MRYLTVAEAANELSVSVFTIRAWLARRKLGYVKLGRSVRVPAAEIARFVERGTVPPIKPRN